MLRCASNAAMQRVWSRLSLLLLALFMQLGVARAATWRTPASGSMRGATPVIAMSSAVALSSVVGAGECVERGNPPRSTPCGEEGAPEDGSNSLEQDSPIDDVSDTEWALPALFAIQLAGENSRGISGGDGMGARHAALEAPFKPPRV